MSAFGEVQDVRLATATNGVGGAPRLKGFGYVQFKSEVAARKATAAATAGTLVLSAWQQRWKCDARCCGLPAAPQRSRVWCTRRGLAAVMLQESTPPSRVLCGCLACLRLRPHAPRRSPMPAGLRRAAPARGLRRQGQAQGLVPAHRRDALERRQGALSRAQNCSGRLPQRTRFARGESRLLEEQDSSRPRSANYSPLEDTTRQTRRTCSRTALFFGPRVRLWRC